MKSFSNKTILVTGAEGTIGSTLVKSFIETECVVFGTDIVQKNHLNTYFFEGDLSDDDIFNRYRAFYGTNLGSIRCLF